MSRRLTDRKAGEKGPELGASNVVPRSLMLSVFREKLFDVLKSEMNKVSWFTG